MKPGKHIDAYIDRHGLTQEQFGDLLKVTKGMVSQWITGYRPISARMALKIEKVTKGEITRHELAPDIYPREHTAA